ncbi:MAG: peptidylprolyl isomerase [Gammaproteobacteria bacterium]|nr:peptidylprolyl isomerase [Gammaproteobacteria bacterium]MBU2675536.1 peptidylprolyl isomerase [Gammaproteobacteria bacterium]NNC57269.1 molecular chaperone SurA [Woeseiaceae bacterium]NNL49271.1 molecular chaperone SurA [Woeseiaceae bacterium]
MIKINTLCAIAASVVASPVALADLSETGEFLDGVAAVVNEGVVLRSQFDEQMSVILQRAEQQDIPLPPAAVLEEQVLERLILNEIQLQRAQRIGLQVSDAMLNDSIRRIAEQNGGRFEDMPALLAQDGVNYADFRRSLRDEITVEQLRRIEVGQSINVSEREIEQCIVDLETNVVVNSDWALSHILLPFDASASAEERDAVLQQANDIYAELQDGADFRELAARYSKGPTALEGGSLGPMQGQNVPTLFADVLPGMKAGDVSEPFRKGTSFHIVKVDDLRSAVERSEVNQVKVRHILITPNEIIDDETAKQRLDDALAKIRDGEDFGEQAKLLSDDPGSANLGGDLGWSGPGTFVPEFDEVVSQSEINVVSEPFRSQFGWHILEVLDRRVYDNTEDLKKRNCDLRIRNSKMEEETQLWMQRLRDEAFVDSRI